MDTIPKEKGARILYSDGASIEFRIDDSLVPSALRALTGTTPLDAEVDALPVPARPLWLHGSVRLLRWYQAQISPRIGQRCVFEPSCSHYAELALRHHGFFRGSLMTGQRLCRCRKRDEGGISCNTG